MLKHLKPKFSEKTNIIMYSVECLAILIGLSLITYSLFYRYKNQTNKPLISEQSPGREERTNDILNPTSPQQKQSNNKSANNSTNTGSNDYCSKTTIAYKTVYENVSWLNKGKQMATGGLNGAQYFCINSAGIKRVTGTVEPLNRVVYIGTYVAPTYSSAPDSDPGTPIGPTQDELAAARQQRIQSCINYVQQISPGSSAYLQCYNIQ